MDESSWMDSQEWLNRFGWNFACTNFCTRLDFFALIFSLWYNFLWQVVTKKPGRAKKFKQKSRALCRYLCMQSFSQIYFAIPEKTLRKRRPFSTGFIHSELDWMYELGWKSCVQGFSLCAWQGKVKQVICLVFSVRHKISVELDKNWFIYNNLVCKLEPKFVQLLKCFNVCFWVRLEIDFELKKIWTWVSGCLHKLKPGEWEGRREGELCRVPYRDRFALLRW